MPLWETPDGMPPGMMLSLHPGDWQVHHLAVLRYGTGKGDFTPEHVDQDVEVEITVGRQVFEHFMGLLGMDPAGPLGSRRMPPVADRTSEPALELQEIEAG